MNRLPRSLAAIAAVALLGTLAGCGADDDTEPTAADPTSGTSTAPSSPSTSATPDPTPTDGDDDGEDGGTTTVPVYFVGDGASRPTLFREFREVTGADPMAEALALLVAGDALDPDYRTLLPALDVQRVEAADGVITVTVGEDSPLSDKAVSPADGRLAVQSLVYTLQGVAQTRDPVRVVGPDGTPLTLLGVNTASGVKARRQLAVLNLVNVTSPQEGATVSGTFTAEGVASSFEATVPWQVLDARGKAVLTSFTTAEGWIDRLYPWTAEVDVSSLAPGEYTFRATTDDPTGGTEGPGPSDDTKTIVVE